MVENLVEPSVPKRDWIKRFVPIEGTDLSAELAFVYIGNKAKTASGLWPADWMHYKDAEGVKEAITKLYVPRCLMWSEKRGALIYTFFDYSGIEVLRAEHGLTADYCEWNFMRSVGSRAVCAPRPIPREYIPQLIGKIDIEKAEKSDWGFGREHYYKPHAPRNQELSGITIDYSPEIMRTDREPYKPVEIKVAPANWEPYIVRLASVWMPETKTAAMVAEMNPADPHHALVVHQFREKKNAGDAELDEFETSALRKRVVRKSQ